jgi:hypothetical protein
MLKIGIGETSQPLRSLKDRRVPIDAALGVLRHASDVKLWSPARIRRRLLNLMPDQDIFDRRLWMQPDCGPAHPHSAVQSGSDKSQDAEKRKFDRLKQLEFDFGEELKDLTISQLLELYPVPVDIREKLTQFATWKATDRSPSLRLAVLEAIASAKQSLAS